MKILQFCIVLLCIVALGGCSKGNSGAAVTIDPDTKKHAAGWAANGSGGAHPDAYFAAPASCEECHGKPSDPAGGISKVSCSNPGRSGVACHASFPHVPGFAGYALHGSVVRDMASGITGMAHCQKCHGSSYTGAGSAPSCIACHKATNPASNAPHAANWLSGNSNGLKHSATNESNAPACAQCHLGGAFSHPAPVPAPVGTPPTCFNGTMCHNTAGHTFTIIDHMVPARSNLASCQSCHATPASGPNPNFTVEKNANLTPGGCEKCHSRPGLAHPYMWVPGRGGQPNTTHANAGTINSSCGLCHGGTAFTGGSGPSCMSTSINGTACHSTLPVGASGVTVGCGSCHGNPPNGAAAPNRDGRHVRHFATATYNITGLTCSACHDTYGTGTATHATKTVFTSMTAPTRIDPRFNESNGVTITTATYNPTTGLCSNVSCHGGKSVNTFIAFGPPPLPGWPAWGSATAFNQTSCFTCHYQRFGVTASLTEAAYRAAVTAGTKPYIGPFSGRPSPASSLQNLHEGHFFLIGGTPPALCLNCHTTPGAAHFADVMLGRRDLPRGFAAGKGTIGGAITSYNPITGSCVMSCHAMDASHGPWY